MELVSSSSRRSRSRLATYAVHLVRTLAGALRVFRQGTRDGADLMARYNALNRLSDDALARRGLARGDIGRVVLGDSDTRE